MKENYELTIVIPCLNEESTIADCIKKSVDFIKKNNVKGEVLVADNNSTDQSKQVSESAGARVVTISQKGYGSALAGGISNAKGKYIIMGDADGSYDFSSIGPFLQGLRSGKDLVMGNRFKGGIETNAMPWLHRYIGNPLLSCIGRLFFGGPCTDFHCGLRGFNTESIKSLQLQTTGMEFASEMLVKALLANLSIAEVPTKLYPDKRNRPPHLNTWRDGWRHLRFLLLYSPKWLFLYPGIFLTVVGTVCTAWLLQGQQYIFDVHTLLYASIFIITGSNAILFWLLTKVYAIHTGYLLVGKSETGKSLDFKMEWGLLLGSLLFLIGIVGSLWAVNFWRQNQFGDLNPATMLRIVIPLVTSIVIGSQVILASFLLGFFCIEHKH